MLEQGGGTIVNVCSVLSIRPIAQNTIYCASKYALLGFSRSLMIEAKEHNIRVIAFLPGGMATSWYDDRPDMDTSKMMKAESVADVLMNTLVTSSDLVTYEVVVAPNTGAGWP